MRPRLRAPVTLALVALSVAACDKPVSVSPAEVEPLLTRLAALTQAPGHVIDLFERIMTSQQDYRMLHQFFDGSGLMQECRKLILELAAELDGIGIAIMSGRRSRR